MAYKKIAGILQGKFIKKINDDLWKFEAVASICYIQCKGNIIIDKPCNIRVREAGMLGTFKRYKLISFAPFAAANRRHNTGRILASSERRELVDSNPAFREGKYKQFPANPSTLSPTGQKAMMKKATAELTKVLRTAPENQIDVGLSPAKRRRLKERRKPLDIDIQEEIFTNEIFKQTEKDGFNDRHSGRYDELGMTKIERAFHNKKQADKLAKENAMEKEIAEFFAPDIEVAP